MKIHGFDDYDSYLNAQIKGTERRMRRVQRAGINKGQRAGINKLEAVMIKELVGSPVEFIICHGSGNGAEVSLLEYQYPNATVIGTDLVEWGAGTVKWDFNQQNDEWLTKADLIYTNSLDHSPDPIKTLGVWCDQLKTVGKLVVQWNLNHVTMMHEKAPYVGGDCFTSHLDEFVQIMDRVVDIKDVRFVAKSRRGGMSFLVVGGKRV